ncbi:MAG: thioesterase family protein [Pseudomonadota bacterium]
MKATLAPGVAHENTVVVETQHLVPALFPSDPALAGMPAVLATPWLVAMIERCAVHALAPHLDPGEGSVGARVELDHTAPTPAGRTVTVTVSCEAVDRRRISFTATAHDGVAQIARARHDRFVIDEAKFRAKLDDAS